MDLAQALLAVLGEGRVRREAPLAPYTTFRIGGPADVLAEVRSAEEALVALRLAREGACRSPGWAADRTSSSATGASAAWWCAGTAARSKRSRPAASAPTPASIERGYARPVERLCGLGATVEREG